jgi:hypothetical protein
MSWLVLSVAVAGIVALECILVREERRKQR